MKFIKTPFNRKMLSYIALFLNIPILWLYGSNFYFIVGESDLPLTPISFGLLSVLPIMLPLSGLIWGCVSTRTSTIVTSAIFGGLAFLMVGCAFRLTNYRSNDFCWVWGWPFEVARFGCFFYEPRPCFFWTNFVADFLIGAFVVFSADMILRRQRISTSHVTIRQ
jgi:hypothetical protein